VGAVTVAGPIDWGSAGRPLHGHAESGDLAVIEAFDDRLVIAVIDGLGHGPGAASAAAVAAAEVRKTMSRPVGEIFAACEVPMRTTRGAVMSLAAFDSSAHGMTWAGLGNVEGVLVRSDPTQPREGLLLRGGVLGSGSAPVRPKPLRLERGDLVVLTSDGIRTGFAASLKRDAPVQELADQILRDWHRPEDDAIVVVARWIAP
jgi:phosphoserine phosphatase RsbX